MTVKELIIELEKIEDKDLDVVYCGEYTEVVEEVYESTQYYGKVEDFSWFARTRKCILII